jgi:hypothetical protein
LANLRFRLARPFDQYAFRHQFKPFPSPVSGIVIGFRISLLNRIPRFPFFASLHLRGAHHSNRFVFLHQFKRLLNPASVNAGGFHSSYSSLVPPF